MPRSADGIPFPHASAIPLGLVQKGHLSPTAQILPIYTDVLRIRPDRIGGAWNRPRWSDDPRAIVPLSALPSRRHRPAVRCAAALPARSFFDFILKG